MSECFAERPSATERAAIPLHVALGDVSTAISKTMDEQSSFVSGPLVELALMTSAPNGESARRRNARAESAGPRYLFEMTRTALCDAMSSIVSAWNVLDVAGEEAWPDLESAVEAAVSVVVDALARDPDLFRPGANAHASSDPAGDGFPSGWTRSQDASFSSTLESGVILTVEGLSSFWVAMVGPVSLGVRESPGPAACDAEAIAERLGLSARPGTRTEARPTDARAGFSPG